MSEQYTKIICNGKVIFTARIYKFLTGKYGFETSVNSKPFEINMNMPTFKSESDAITWIENNLEWKRQ